MAIRKIWQKPEMFFLVFSLFFGLSIALITGPFQAPDEFQHFNKAYSLSTGDLFGSSDYIPKSIENFQSKFKHIPFHNDRKISKKLIFSSFSDPLNPELSVEISFPNVGVYSPVPYIPQATGILIGRFLNFPPISIMLMGRFFNILFWIFLIIIAIKISPINKWGIAFIALLPMSIFQAASNSADTSLNGIAFVTIAFFLNLYTITSNKIENKDFFIIGLLIFLLGMCKPMYAFIGVLFLGIRPRAFSSLIKYSIVGIILFCVLVITILISSKIGADLYMKFPNQGLRPFDQVMFILNNPTFIFHLLINTLITMGGFYWKSYIGILGWLDTNLPDYVYYISILAIIISNLFDIQKEYKISPIQKFVTFSIFLFLYLSISFALYITWTPYKAEVISGFQGRYLIPCMPLIFITLSSPKFKISEKLLVVLLTASITIILVMTLISLYNRYYL